METPTNTVVATASRSSTPVQDEDTTMAPEKSMASLHLTEDQMRSEYIDPSFFTNTGIILQFINGNCPGTTSMIGGMRLHLADIRKAPAYLSKYKQQIKLHAIKALNRHFREMQCGLGAAETLFPDDFGMSFSLASISHIGTQLNPNRRNEAPLFYCLCPGLISPVTIVDTNWDTEVSAESAHVVNVYINLLPLHLRRSHVLSRARDEITIAAAAREPTTSHGTGPKKYKFTPGPSPLAKTAVAATVAENALLTANVESLKKEVIKLKGQALPSPKLPQSKPPQWPAAKDSCPELPDDV